MCTNRKLKGGLQYKFVGEKRDFFIHIYKNYFVFRYLKMQTAHGKYYTDSVIIPQ